MAPWKVEIVDSTLMIDTGWIEPFFQKENNMALITCDRCKETFSMKVVTASVKCPYCGRESTWKIMLREMEENGTPT